MAREDYRTCPVDGCETQILPGLLMCRTHWHLVPRQLQAEVKESWRAFRQRRDMDALARYRLAADAAIRAVDPCPAPCEDEVRP